MNAPIDRRPVTHSTELAAERLDALPFSPLQIRVEPRGCMQWSGRCDALDEIEACASSSQHVRLQLEILTSACLPLVIAMDRATSWRATARVIFSGLIYLRVHNLDFETAHIDLALSRRKSPPLPRSAHRQIVTDFLSRLRAA